MVQEIKDENMKTGETLSLWQAYASLSGSCSAQLEHLLHEWEELSRSSLSPAQDTQGLVCSVKVSLGLWQTLDTQNSSVAEISCLIASCDATLCLCEALITM